MAHPDVPTCKDCQAFMYDVDTWEKVLRLLKNADGELEKLPIARPKGSPTPCARCPKSGPKDGLPRPDKELNPRNLQAFWFHQECSAVGEFPKDRIVRRNAAIIRWVEQDIERTHLQLTPMLLLKGLTRK